MTSNRSMRVCLPVLLLFLAAPAAAHAQMGLLKKAKRKLEKKAAPEQSAQQGGALTSASMNQMLAGLRASQQKLAELQQLRTQRDAEEKQLDQMRTRDVATRDAYNDVRGKTDNCRSGMFDKLSDEHNKEIQKRAPTNAAEAAHMQAIAMKYSQQQAQAQMKGDTAAMRKLQIRMMQEIAGVDPFAMAKADTAKVDATCGKMPAEPAALAAEDAKEKDINDKDERLRELEAGVNTGGAKAAGMDVVHFAQLKERIIAILGNNGRGYPASEVALVNKHRAELQRFGLMP